MIHLETIHSNRKVKNSFIQCLRDAPQAAINKSVVSRKLSISRTSIAGKPKKLKGQGFSKKEVDLVHSFYKDIEVSTCYPNKRKNAKEAVYVLKDSGPRTYQHFLNSHPEIKMSSSTFWNLRPKKIVKKKSAAKWLQCLCDVCENIDLLIKAIKGSLMRSKMEVPSFLETRFKLCASTLCHPRVFVVKCLDRLCDDCGINSIEEALAIWSTDNPTEQLSWWRWEQQRTEINGKDVGRLTKVEHRCSRGEVVAELVRQLRPYGFHVTNFLCQLAAFKENINSGKRDEAIIVVDFAENFTCQRQSEAQSAYYSRNQVTIHPMVIVINRASGEQLRDSIVAISDDLTHDSASVYSFLDILLWHISINYTDIKKVSLWSDGCAAQYKSAKPFFNIATSFGQPAYSIT